MKQLELDNNLNPVETADDSFYHEVTINGSRHQQNKLLVKTLQQYSKSDNSRWITCILPEQIDKQLLNASNITPKRVQQVVSKENREIERLCIKAIDSGQSYGILAMIKRLNAKQRVRLKTAAKQSGIHCTVIVSY